MNCTLHRLLLSSATLALIVFHVAASLSAYPVVPGADTGECSFPAGENLVPVRREVYGNGRIIDITHRLTSDLPSYESMGSLGQFLWLAFSMKNGSLTNNSEMKLPAHTGTHVDAPGHVYDHYYEAGFDVDTLDLEVLNAHHHTLPSRVSTLRVAMNALPPLLLALLLIATAATAAAANIEAYPDIASVGDCSVSDGGEGLKPIRREVYDGGKIFDISHRLTSDMPSWGLEDGLGQFLRLAASMKNGSLANNSEMKLPTHTGTHVDAPGHVYDHYFDAGFDVDTLDLAVLNGPALLVDVPKDKNLTAEVMESLHIPKGVRRVLFRTLNTDRRLMYKKEFDTSYVGFMRDGAKWLVENTDIKLVGIDYLSVAAYDDLIPSHLVFLESREIILVEGLKLEDVPAGVYTVHCLPLRLLGAEGSPIRCILIK